MKLSCELSPLFLISALLFFTTSNTHAQVTPTCTLPGSDADGDGWGWENNASCRVMPELSNTCIDTDGDGWGWDGIASCAINATEDTNNSESNNSMETESATCVDSDGDGYGWDGVATCTITTTEDITDSVQTETPECVDSDGDGYGWNGTASCVMQTSAATADSNPLWYFCGADSEPGYGYSWGTATVNSWVESSCVRRCTNGAIPLNNIPGWHYDPDSNAECIVDTDPAQSPVRYTQVPLYDGNSGQLIKFSDQFAYHLYQDDGNWECQWETRSSNADPFLPRGTTRTIQFDVSGENWFFNRHSLRQSISIRDDSIENDRFEYEGHMQLSHNNLSIYGTSLDRVACSRIIPTEDKSLPENLHSFDSARTLNVDDLIDKTLQCRLIESMGRRANYPLDEGFQSSAQIPFGSSWLDVGAEYQVGPITRVVYDTGTFYQLFPLDSPDYFGIYKYLTPQTIHARSDGRPEVAHFDADGGRKLIFKDMGSYVMSEAWYSVHMNGAGFDVQAYSVCTYEN